MDFWTCRSAGSASSSASAAAAKAEGIAESPRQPPDSPVVGGADVRRKVQSQSEEGEGAGSGSEAAKAEGGGARRKGVLEGGLFLGRKKAPPVPHLSSLGSEAGGGSDSSANASPSPTKLSTSPRHRKLAPELSNQDSSL